MDQPKITPRLIVQNGAKAIAFYRAVFGAREVERYATPTGQIVHAALDLDGATISLADAAPDWQNLSPDQLSGSPVILQLRCDDPDAVCAAAVKHGAEVIFPVADHFYGYREGRIRDPFGHLWILSKLIREMTPEEIQRAMDKFSAG